MSCARAGFRVLTRAAASLAALTLPAAMAARVQADEPTLPQSALHACEAITAADERLACYDRIAGRSARSESASEPAAVRPMPGEPPAPVAATRGAASPLQAPAAPPRHHGKDSFGLYSAEHPAPPLVAATLETHVLAIGRSAGGRITVTVEGGGVWELDEADPILAVGDAVTINRAALGSFLMKTPAKRVHRVHRLH